MLDFSQILKSIKWQDLLEEGKMAAMRFEEVQRFIFRRTFWKLIINAKLPAEVKEKTMRKAQGMNFKDLSLSFYGHLVLLQFRPLY